MLVKNRPKKVFMVIALVPVILAIIPIKISIKSPDDINNKKYYIIYLIPDGTTGAGDLICYDQDNIYYNNIHIEGKLPQKIITKDIYESGTTFIIYGNIVSINNNYTLYSQEWDILYNINRNPNSLRIDFKKFITIYDLKYFDFFLSN